jgi:acyl-CoA synthetase (AMP-forming)/AMP-acid ligase II
MQGHYADLWHRIALAAPERPAIVTVGESTLTNAEFDDAAARFATLLTDLGVGRDDKVSILLHNRPEWLIAFAGCLKLGAVPVPLNFRYRPREVAALLDDSDSVVLVHAASLADVVAEAVGMLDRPIALLQVPDVDAPLPPGTLAFAEHGTRPPRPHEDAVDGEFFIYTGGTTGAPKAAMWGVGQMLSMQLYNAYLTAGLPLPENADDVVRMATDPASPRIVALALSPYMHGTALTTVINALLLGGTIVVLPTPRFDPRAAVQTILDEGVTRVAVAGDAIAIPLVEAAEELGITELPSLTSMLSAGMRFSDSTKERLHALAPNLAITDILASTEGGAVGLGITRSAADLPSRFRMTPATVVLDEQQEEVQDVPGAVGRIAFTGGMPRGYYKDPAKTAENFVEIRGKRHIIPGDIVRVEEDGYVELLGRGASVVNSGGEKIFPSEVEESILRFPGIDDAVVFGIPDPRWGEVVAAVVAAERPEQIDVTALAEHVGVDLAGYKKPRRVLVVKDLERSPTGKIDLAVVRERTAKEGMTP